MSNFTTRVISGIVGGALMIFLIVAGTGRILGIGLCPVAAIGFLELTKACKVREEGKKINILEVLGIIATILWYGALVFLIDTKQTTNVLMYGLGIVVLLMIANMAVYVFAFPRFNSNQIMTSIFSFLYCPIMLSFIYLIRIDENVGFIFVWLIFVCSWGSDIFAYLVGVKFGKRKLAPVLSPKKSIEGAIGGILGATVLGGIYASLMFSVDVKTIVTIMIISAIGAVISMIGDLAASAIKRNNDIKDYGKIIPGHGGIMDRFDSVIFVAPILYGLLLIFLKIRLG